jgi:nitroreductase
MTAPVPDDPWLRLLETATLAPSPHNVQPWRIRRLDATRAQLFIERRRTLPNEDVTGSFIILTMGIFTEALRLAAAHERLALDVRPAREFEAYSSERIRASSEPQLLFADLQLEPDASVEAEYPLELFRRRRTSRLHYAVDPIAPQARDTLVALAGRWGQRHSQVTDAALIERLLDLNVRAVFEDLNHPPYRDEMRAWLRYGDAASRRRLDGLDARCMNVHPIELWTAFHLSPMLRWPGLSAVFRRRYRGQIGPVATLGLLGGPFWEPARAYDTGRFLIRFWLEVARFGYSIHPYGNLVTHRPTAATMEALTGERDVWLVFKIGRSAEPPASRRLPLEEVWHD